VLAVFLAEIVYLTHLVFVEPLNTFSIFP
jgi:hypothetical protein